MSERLTGQKLGAYRVGELLGEGAMGEVYRGVHEELQRKVAIKALKRSLDTDGELIKRIFAEAKAVNIICHENIVECTDLVHDPDGRSYIVMELLEGRTLGAALRGGRMAPVAAVRIAAQIADAIGAAHDKNIIHRDLKPDNVFLIDRAGHGDYVKVLDFGIARLHGLTATAQGALIGTPAYMSPEQAAGERAVAASDIYALAVILFQLVTGKLPLLGDTLPEMLAAHIAKQPPRADAIAPEVPAKLADAIEQALAKDPARRPESMHAFRAMILRAVDLPVRPSKRPSSPAIALDKTCAPGELEAARTQASTNEPALGNTSLSNASGEASLRRPASRSRSRWWIAGTVAMVAGGVTVAVTQWPRTEAIVAAAPSAVTFEELVTTGCNSSRDPKGELQLTCEVLIAPAVPEDPESQPWIAYVDLTPQAGVVLKDDRGCARVATIAAVQRLAVTDCAIREGTVHGQRMRVTATRDGVTHTATVQLAVATPAAQHGQGYRMLLSNRSYTLADVWFLDAEKRAELLLANNREDPEAPHMLVRSIYYRAFTHYMRLADCAMRHRVEGKPCSDTDMDRWYNEAIRILDNPLALALQRQSIPQKVARRQQNDRLRLNNELVLRFSKGKISAGSSVHRNLTMTSKQCTDFVQQSHAFLAMIAATTGRGAEANQQLKAILADMIELPKRCGKDDAERDALTRSANAVLFAEYGVCSGQPVLNDVTALVCTIRHEFPDLPADPTLAKTCADAPNNRDDDLARAVRLFATNVRRRGEGLPWRGGCHQKRLASREPADVKAENMNGEPDAIDVHVAAVDAKDRRYHYVVDAEGRVHERRPLGKRGEFPGSCLGRSLGIAVTPSSPIATTVAEELVDELRVRYGIGASHIFSTPRQCGN